MLPNYLEVTKPLNYHPFSKNRDDVVFHTDMVDSSYDFGVVGVVISFGNTVRTYDKEKLYAVLLKTKTASNLRYMSKLLIITLD